MSDLIQDQRDNGQLRDGRYKGWFDTENDLIDREDLDIYEKMAYQVISRHTNKEDQAFPSYKTIAQKGRMSRRKAVDAIDGLISKGLLLKEARKKLESSSNMSNLYTILSAKVNDEGSAQHAPPSAPHAPGVVHSMHHPSAHGAPEVNLFNNTNYNNPLLHNNININQREEEEKLINKNIQEILNKAQVYLYSGSEGNFLTESIAQMYLSNELKVDGLIVSQLNIRDRLEQISIEAVDMAYLKFKRISKNTKIINSVKYFQALLYNAILEVGITDKCCHDQ
ncbi:helix-turn-helix domain-containing protein [Alkaliphilus pronyensis]|uniref:Helix-turn-helix domain-containing protein n=1 Tax=Alkaliphilus pronyensis TaxID=1482732 RepID=A0A6I0F6I9_9FIRM|nr:helix-turn-helix domain-containing protein [Alkaliphilus pronyensis]KAB3535649.1 helix-turn-helix domain-containing protein [Alkaliphilus pronyensis]